MAKAWYNENDPKAANWLRELIHEGLIAPGDVDERSIWAVSAADLRGYAQCHFFAGIGLWSLVLRRRGWPDERPVGTGSCPCQPFSPSGKGQGFNDPRHLWPAWFRIIVTARAQGQRWTDSILGEQSANAGHWLDLVRSQLEALGYAFGAPDLPAAGFTGAHRRQRFYWVADANDPQWWADRAPGHFADWPQAGRIESPGDLEGRGGSGVLADADGQQWDGAWSAGPGRRSESSDRLCPVGVGHPDSQGQPIRPGYPDERGAIRVEGPAFGATGSLLGCDWLLCHDARVRPVEVGTFPLAPTDSTRVGKLRGYGNALDVETATAFVKAYMDSRP